MELILLGVFFCLSVCFLGLRFTYWRRRKVPFAPLNSWKSLIYGNITEGRHQALQFADFYRNHRHANCPIVGIYIMFAKPAVLIVDSSLIRKVLGSDFKYFQNRGMFYNEIDDVLSAILGTLDHKEWKLIRSKLTPAFTPAKMREKFSIMKEVGEKLVEGLQMETENEIEIRGLFGRFTVEIIGFVALGLEFECVNNPRTQLHQMIQMAMQSHSKFPCNILKSSSPKLARFLRMRKHPKEVGDFFVKITEETIQHRLTRNEHRNDYMQLLIDAGLTTNQIAALTFDFLSAGYSDVTSTLSYCLYELSLPENLHIQENARNEIAFVLEQHGNELTYTALDQMVYCKAIVNGNFYVIFLIK